MQVDNENICEKYSGHSFVSAVSWPAVERRVFYWISEVISDDVDGVFEM